MVFVCLFRLFYQHLRMLGKQKGERSQEIQLGIVSPMGSAPALLLSGVCLSPVCLFELHLFSKFLWVYLIVSE